MRRGELIEVAGSAASVRFQAAKKLAAQRGLTITRVDSRYIGETEKNIRRMLRSADAAGCILFFDEADALFGKRTGVQDSHDRYANQEVSHLLEQMVAKGAKIIVGSSRKKRRWPPADFTLHL
ncbi:MAG: ATP-binding protein [Bryobacterales bacterium]|nr:ATP-binding protein [Acidobacteriota bacterium]MCB9383321.1 ATP-binding protein [Bryobacterales bacterium]